MPVSEAESQRRVLIAGCGYVGTALARHLVTQGWRAFGLRRTPGALPPGIDPVIADLSRPESLVALPEALDAVVYAAAADDRSPEAYHRAYVAGLEHLLAALRHQHNDRFRLLYVSSTGVYGVNDGSWVDEETDPQSRSATSRLLLAGEEVCRARAGVSSVLRLGGIYGPGRRRLIDRVLAGQAACPTGTPVYSNRIHLDDIVGALTHLLRIDAPQPLYLGVDHAPAETGEVVRWMAARLGAPTPPIGAEASPESNKRCRNTRLVASGYTFRYPTFREGYSQVLAELGLLKNTATAAS